LKLFSKILVNNYQWIISLPLSFFEIWRNILLKMEYANYRSVLFKTELMQDY